MGFSESALCRKYGQQEGPPAIYLAGIQLWLGLDRGGRFQEGSGFGITFRALRRVLIRLGAHSEPSSSLSVWGDQKLVE